MRQRLDSALVKRGLIDTRHQALNYIKLGYVAVNQTKVTEPDFKVSDNDKIRFTAKTQLVSRAGLKLASIADKLNIDFQGKIVLDVGSSTGGFTDYSLQKGAKKVIAVDVGTEQLHPKLRSDERIEIHEKTDIRNMNVINQKVDIVLIDVSFISLRLILRSIFNIARNAEVVALFKPQFEGSADNLSAGVIKNETIRRRLIKEFENWLTQNRIVIVDKVDSNIEGKKGNLERFYLLNKAS